MYFWKIEQLKTDLIERPATEREALPYLVGTYLLWIISLYPGLATDFGLKFFIDFFINFISTACGIYWLYKINAVKPNNYFLQRFIMMGWVLVIRFIVFFAIPLCVLTIALNAVDLGTPDSKSTSWADIVIGLVSVVIYYWYSARHLKEVAMKAKY